MHREHNNSPAVRSLFLSTAMLLLGAAGAFSQGVGPGSVIVHSKFGGQIFGFDIDQNGTEGLLTEAVTKRGGRATAAIETFDQATGAILDVVEMGTHDEWVTLGIVGTSVGLMEDEHSQRGTVVNRTFPTMNPLESNQITGEWTPPLGSGFLIMPNGVSRSQGTADVAVFAYNNNGTTFIPHVFSSNVAANTFGPVVEITDSKDFGSVPPQIAYDSVTNQAILGGGPGCFGCLPVIGLVDLVNGGFTTFTGVGFGFINGIAVDSADGIFCTTTEDDAGVEFYNLATNRGVEELLPGSGGSQLFSGADVEFDPINKLFLVAQPVSSSSPSGSTIYVYDTKGNVLETLNGFGFSNASSVVPMHIALNPGQRSGFVDGPSGNVNEIQSFTY